jgi:hypothetical protein
MMREEIPYRYEKGLGDQDLAVGLESFLIVPLLF